MCHDRAISKNTCALCGTVTVILQHGLPFSELDVCHFLGVNGLFPPACCTFPPFSPIFPFSPFGSGKLSGKLTCQVERVVLVLAQGQPGGGGLTPLPAGDMGVLLPKQMLDDLSLASDFKEATHSSCNESQVLSSQYRSSESEEEGGRQRQRRRK